MSIRSKILETFTEGFDFFKKKLPETHPDFHLPELKTELSQHINNFVKTNMRFPGSASNYIESVVGRLPIAHQVAYMHGFMGTIAMHHPDGMDWWGDGSKHEPLYDAVDTDLMHHPDQDGVKKSFIDGYNDAKSFAHYYKGERHVP